MKILKKIKYGFMALGTTLLMLPTKIYARQPTLYGPMPNKYSEKETSLFEPNASFWIKCVAFFIIPLVFIIGLIIYAKASKSKKSTKVIISIFLALLIIAMLTGAVLFVVGSILEWF